MDTGHIYLPDYLCTVTSGAAYWGAHEDTCAQLFCVCVCVEGGGTVNFVHILCAEILTEFTILKVSRHASSLTLINLC